MARPRGSHPKKQFALSLGRPALAALRMMNPHATGQSAEAIVMHWLLNHLDLFPSHLRAHLLAMGAKSVLPGDHFGVRAPSLEGARVMGLAVTKDGNDPSTKPENFCPTCHGTGMGPDYTGTCLTCDGDGVLSWLPGHPHPIVVVPAHQDPFRGEREDKYLAMLKRTGIGRLPMSAKRMIPPTTAQIVYAAGTTASPSVPPVQDNQDTTTAPQDLDTTGDDDTLTI